jgi:iron complex transport system ATP-binding protein
MKAETGAAMLSVLEVSAGYGSRPVLSGVTLNVAPGEFVGLIGPNGCGKTTLLRVIGGVLAPSAGRVLMRGVELSRIGRRELARTMACLPQDVQLDVPFTVREVALMGRSPHLRGARWETHADHEIADRAMRLADAAELADRPITEISRGERQRAFIAMCLAQEPELLLLDEPTNHLDVGHQLSTLDLIRQLNRRDGLTVVAVLHDLNLAAEYCDRLVVLHQGRVGAEGPPREVVTSEMVARVYGAAVTVADNPVSRQPHLMLAAGMNCRKDFEAAGAIPPESRSGDKEK